MERMGFNEAAHRSHHFREFVVGFGRRGGNGGEFRVACGVIVHAPEMIAVGHRVNVPSRGRISRPWRGRSSSRNDFGAEERDYIGAFGEEEARDDFFGDGGTAENVAAFEDENLLASFGEIGSVDQAVVAAADDDCVVMLRHAVKLHTNPRMKEIAETGRARQFYWDGAIWVQGAGRRKKDLTQSSLRAEHRGHREGTFVN